ncbi:MAG: hypothetical protein IPK52_13165 [Chloroflexi bacterium]|nr:hypothetical protein [Chloroflexota bacterium]
MNRDTRLNAGQSADPARSEGLRRAVTLLESRAQTVAQVTTREQGKAARDFCMQINCLSRLSRLAWRHSAGERSAAHN